MNSNPSFQLQMCVYIWLETMLSVCIQPWIIAAAQVN